MHGKSELISRKSYDIKWANGTEGLCQKGFAKEIVRRHNYGQMGRTLSRISYDTLWGNWKDFVKDIIQHPVGKWEGLRQGHHTTPNGQMGRTLPRTSYDVLKARSRFTIRSASWPVSHPRPLYRNNNRWDIDLSFPSRRLRKHWPDSGTVNRKRGFCSLFLNPAAVSPRHSPYMLVTWSEDRAETNIAVIITRHKTLLFVHIGHVVWRQSRDQHSCDHKTLLFVHIGHVVWRQSRDQHSYDHHRTQDTTLRAYWSRSLKAEQRPTQLYDHHKTQDTAIRAYWSRGLKTVLINWLL